MGLFCRVAAEFTKKFIKKIPGKFIVLGSLCFLVACSNSIMRGGTAELRLYTAPNLGVEKVLRRLHTPDSKQ